MIAAALAAIILGGHVQPCGPDNAPTGGSVVWWGSASADLAPVGVGACTMSAWVDPVGFEVVVPGEGNAPEFWLDDEQVGPDWNGNADA